MTGSLVGVWGLLQAAPPDAPLPGALEFFLATPVAVGINIAIVTLTLLAVANLVWGELKLTREWKAAKQLRKTSAERPTVLGLADKRFPDTLAAGRIEALDAARLERVDLQSLAAAAAEELHQRVAPARAVAAGVVLLGLAGTLIGLSIGLAPLADVFRTEVPDLGSFWTAMNDSVSGMRTAFSTTLAGVGGALVLGLWLSAHGRRQGLVLAELERATAIVVIPALQRDDGSGLTEVVKKLDALHERLEDRFSSLIRKLNHHGAQISGKVVDGFEDATAEIHRGFEDLIGPFEQVRDATLRLVGTPEEGAEPLAAQVARLGAAATELERSVASVQGLIPELRDTLIRSFREQSEATRNLLDTYYRQMAERVEEQSRSTRSLSDEVRRTAESVGNVAESLSGFATAAEDYRKVWREVAEAVGRAEGTLDTRLAAMGQSVRQGVEDLVEKQGNVQQRVLSSLTEFETQLSDAIETIERERRRAVSRSEELIVELRNAVKDAIRQIDARSEGQQENVTLAIRQGLQELKLELRDLLVPQGGERSTRGDGSRPRTTPQPREAGPRGRSEGESAPSVPERLADAFGRPGEEGDGPDQPPDGNEESEE